MRDDAEHTWTNWAGNQSCTPQKSVSAASEEEVAAAVKGCEKPGFLSGPMAAGIRFLQWST